MGLGTNSYADCLLKLKDEILQLNHEQQVAMTWGFISAGQADAFAKFKNLKAAPRQSPLSFDLSDPYELSSRLYNPEETTGIRLHSLFVGITQYEAIVLNLRSGDSIHFDGQSFTLGEFLGRGNTTHVWTLADNPEAVIRLPFNIAAIRKPGLADVSHRAYYLENTYEALKKSKNSPQIIKADPKNRFLVIARVHGSQTGADFIRKLSNSKINPESERNYFLKSELDALFSSAENIRFKSLVDAMRADQVFYPDREIYAELDPLRLDYVDVDTEYWPGMLLGLSRQYVWDENLERWFLIDGI